MKKLLFLCLATLLATLPLPAQTSAGRLKPNLAGEALPLPIAKQIGLFFTNLQNNNVKHAYDDLFKGTRQSSDSDLINDFVTMTNNTIGKFGNIDSYELIDTRSFGSRLLAVAYLTRHHDKFYRWQFIYQSANGSDWLLNNMAVDDLRAFLPSYPTNLPPPDNIQIKMEKFFLSIQNRAIDNAFNDITKGSSLDGSGEQISAFISKTNLALANFGAMKQYELFDNRPLGKNLRLLTYLSTLELQTLRWQFVFTVDKDNKWNLLTIRVDDQIAAGIINSN
ncbi:MAG: hypothetical protein LBH01_02555 [Verrucomicrobiales bacterium]|jgi:hypothetical protein|nr:hypothetical protein [Verrucomicrobiales bacterium]